MSSPQITRMFGGLLGGEGCADGRCWAWAGLLSPVTAKAASDVPARRNARRLDKAAAERASASSRRWSSDGIWDSRVKLTSALSSRSEIQDGLSRYQSP